MVTATGTAASAKYEDATMQLKRSKAPHAGIGPHRPYVTEILIGGVVPLKNQALLNKTKQGYLFRGGQQDNNITITEVGGRLQFVDTHTASWKWMPKACSKIDVPQGIGARCKIGPKFSMAKPMLVEVWPRLGDDTVNSTALSAFFDVAVLGDRGEDVVYFGAGNNFFNGAQDSDRAYGGPGNDWIRTGLDDDFIDGGAGDDYLVGVDGNDTIYGGPGNDRIGGLNGNDTIFSGEGNDIVACGNGKDNATITSGDKPIACETINRS
jgi:Ca2+-binding RTX toxin-like protein